MPRVKLTEEERRERKRASLKAYYERNKAKISARNTERARERRSKDPEAVRKKQREYVQKYRDKSRDKVNENARSRRRDRRKSDPDFVERVRRQCVESYYRNHDKRKAEKRAIHAEHREKDNLRRKAHYHAHKEENREMVAKKLHQSRCDNPLPFLLRGARERALRKNLQFNLTKEYLATIWLGRCAVTGMPFKTGKGFGPKFFSPSLDRIDRDKGYVEGNVRFVIWAVNVMKYDGTDDDLLAVAQAIIDNKKFLSNSNT